MLSLALQETLEPFDVEVRPARDRVIVAPRGELDAASVGRVASEIDALVRVGFADVVLDLRAVTFMDAEGLRLVMRQAGRGDATVQLIDGPSAVSRIFDLAEARTRLPFLPAHELRRRGH